MEHRQVYALAKEVTGKHAGLAIRLCSAAGRPLATFVDGAEMQDREVGFGPLIPQPNAKVGLDDVNPALFEPGCWDRGSERFISNVKMDERMPLNQLRLFLD